MSKLRIPAARAARVSRPRLMMRLADGIKRPLTLLSAPAGFGKTTLLAEWIADQQPPVAWVSLDEGDNDPTRFWSYILSALQTLQTSVGEGMLALLRAPQPPPPDLLLTWLLNELNALPAPLSLVLDDYHVIKTTAIHDSLTFLLNHWPAHAHLIITSRSDPPLPLPRLRARDQLIEIRADDLRFTPDEAAAFLNDVMGLHLSSDTIAALENRTEGWIAGLQLAALSLRGRDPAHVLEAIEQFSGSHRYVIDYLVEEVLRQQPAVQRDFLIETAILDRLTAPLCNTLTDRHDSQDLLVSLERANLFLVPLDDRREWYRYHHLFADFLRAQLAPDRERALHRIAAQWHADRDFAADAIKHWLAAGEYVEAARAIEPLVYPLTMRGETATLQQWLAALPAELIRTRPRLCLAQAWLALALLQMTTIEPHVQAAEEAQRTAETDRALEGEILALRAIVASGLEDAPRAIDQAQRALELLPAEDSLLRGVVAVSLGMAYFADGELNAAAKYLADAGALLETADSLGFELVARSALAATHEERGRLREATKRFRQTLVKGERHGQPLPLTGVAVAYLGLSTVLHEQGQLAEAIAYLQRGIDLCRKLSSFSGVLVTLLVNLARVLRTRGELAEAVLAMQEADELVRQMNYPPGIEQVEAHWVPFWLEQGKLTEVAAWADRREPALQFTGNSSLRAAAEIELLMLARARHVQQRDDEALSYIAQVKQSAVSVGRQRPQIEAALLEAIIYRARHQLDAAQQALEAALAFAAPENYVRPFIDEGTAAQELLISLRPRLETNAQRAYADRVLSAFAARSKTVTEVMASPIQNPRPQVGPLIEPLNERELEVLRLIAEGLSNREIADRLVVAVGTVKWYINNLYGKLGVASRTQALARAKELGLI